MIIRKSPLPGSFAITLVAFAACSGESAPKGQGTTGDGSFGLSGASTTSGTSGATSGSVVGPSVTQSATVGTTGTVGTSGVSVTSDAANTVGTSGVSATSGAANTVGATSVSVTSGAANTVGTSGVGGAGGVASTGGAGGTGSITEPEFHIYLALGQSNMQGAAHVPDEPIFHPRVQALQGQNCPASDGHSYGYGEWREMFTPMIRCYEGTRDYPGASGPIGLGPADSFAVAMAEAAGPNVTIGIVGAAYGGTDIQAHLPNCGSVCKPPYGDVSGAPVVNGTTPIYEWIKDLATKAQEVGEIKGIIFHHGESNSGQESWLTNTQTYIDSLRSDLGLDPAKVPFVAGELPRTGCCAGHNSLVQRIPDYVENGHWVSSGPMEDGTVLGDRGDSLHWSTFSVIEMGKRYAAKMLEAQGQ